MNLPLQFIERIKKQFPAEAEEFLVAINNPPANSIRMNPAKSVPFTDVTSVPWCKHGYYLDERPVYALDPLFHAGAYYVQESSSMILEHVFRQLRKDNSPWNVLDLCAAPGGKSTHLLQCLQPLDVLVSNEVIPARNAILQENVLRWGYPNVLISRSDPAHFSKCSESFDFIWVDAPCSGEGMFRKDPDTIKEWNEDNLETCRLRQNRIIQEVWPSLKPGGFLAYSTCTFNPEENERLILNFMETHDAKGIPVQTDPAWGIFSDSHPKAPYLQFLPHRSKGEGFFVTILQKAGDPESNIADSNIVSAPKNLQKFQTLLNPQFGPYHFYLKDDELMAVPHRARDLFTKLSKNLFFTHHSLNLGKLIREEINPSQELAWNIAFNQESYPYVELSEKDALEYLRKSSNLQFKSEKGWVLVKHRGIALGWAKQLGNRINNYYPSNYRLRLQ